MTDAHELARRLRPLLAQLRRTLRAQADPGDFTPSQTSVMQRLEAEGPMTTSALARAEGMRSQSMGAIVQALEERGILTRSPDPADGRQSLVALEEGFRRTLLENRAVREDWLARELTARLTAEELAELDRAVGSLARLVEP